MFHGLTSVAVWEEQPTHGTRSNGYQWYCAIRITNLQLF